MHRDPEASSGGNAQKRIRLCPQNPINAEALIFDDGEQPEDVDDADALDIGLGLTDTERKYLRAARLGQGGFRKALLEEFCGRCPITGIEKPALLRASHIKPWRTCTNAERLDPKKGMLLSVVADALFDLGGHRKTGHQPGALRLG
jgi:hypothetical protein